MTYEAVPFAPWIPGRERIVSEIVRKTASMDTLFTDFQSACKPLCDDVISCDRCRGRLEAVASALADPHARVWEVWKMGDEDEVVGIIYLTKIIPGCDALAHYVFFDHGLHDKTQLLETMIQWCFSEHEGWYPLRRITVEIPTFAFALAKHATQKLGFGGSYSFEYTRKRGGKFAKKESIPVEGARRSAIKWRGENADLLIMGRLNAA